MTRGRPGCAPDPGESGPVEVVAAVVVRQGRYLVGRRPRAKRHGGLWEFPGGKVDPGETPADALRRELWEELELVVDRVQETLWQAPDTAAGFRIRFVAATTSSDAEPRLLEHEAIGWFRPDELAEMLLAPADAAFVAWLLAGEPVVDPGR